MITNGEDAHEFHITAEMGDLMDLSRDTVEKAIMKIAPAGGRYAVPISDLLERLFNFTAKVREADCLDEEACGEHVPKCRKACGIEGAWLRPNFD